MWQNRMVSADIIETGLIVQVVVFVDSDSFPFDGYDNIMVLVALPLYWCHTCASIYFIHDALASTSYRIIQLL